MISELGINAGDIAGATVYEGAGCEACKFTGYRGREAIYEFLPMTEGIRDMIVKRATAQEIQEKAITAGMKTLRTNGWQKIARGLTTPSEVIRVTQEQAD